MTRSEALDSTRRQDMSSGERGAPIAVEVATPPSDVPARLRQVLSDAGTRALDPRAWRIGGAGIIAFWVAGLILVCLLVGHFLIRALGIEQTVKAYDWALYALLGSVVPLLLVGVPLFRRWLGWPLAPFLTAQRVVAFIAVLWSVFFLGNRAQVYGWETSLLILALTLVQVVAFAYFWRREIVISAATAVLVLVSLVGWTVVTLFELPAVARQPIFLVSLVCAFVLALSVTRPLSAGSSVNRVLARPGLWVDIATLTFIAFMSFRIEDLFVPLGEVGAPHHWGAWVGTAELIRQGGWLLWDTPGQYGFLSLLSLAILPTDTPWQSLYIHGSLAFFVVGAGSYLVMRAAWRGFLPWCFAVTLAVFAPMFEPRYPLPRPLLSMFVLPNLGAIRYVWCFVLLALLVWEFLGEDCPARRRRFMVAGSVFWLIGVLWSAESAFFCSAAWLPAYCALVARESACNKHRWRRVLAWSILPLAMLGAVMAVIWATYLRGLGHGPDWLALVDFVRGHGMVAFVVINDPTGPVSIMLFVYLLLATSLVYLGLHSSAAARPLAACLGLLGGFWAVASYGFTRGRLLQHPLTYLALAFMAVLLLRSARGGSWRIGALAGMVPLFAVLLAAPLAAIITNPLAVTNAAGALGTAVRNGLAVEPLIPPVAPELQELLTAVEVGPDDPISFGGSYLGNLMPPWVAGSGTASECVVSSQDWLLGHPYVVLEYVPDGRGALYTERFIARNPRGGWFIQHKPTYPEGSLENAPAQGVHPWLFEVIWQTHVPTRVAENPGWRMVWYDYVGADSPARRPALLPMGVPELPADLLVNGAPLRNSVLPPVWGYFGADWSDPAHDDAPRSFAGTGAIHLYAPHATEVQMTVRREPGQGGRRLLRIAVNGGDPQDERLSRRQPAEVALALEAGWNTVTLTDVPRAFGTDPTPSDRLPISEIALETSLPPADLPAAPAGAC